MATKRRLSPREYVIFLLGRREYSEKELRARLKLRACTAVEIDDAMAFITAQGLQSDARYAASKTRIEGRRKGNRGIQYALASKGISAEQIAMELESLAPEVDRVIDAVRRFENKELDLKLKGKVWRFLAGRGFAQPAITAALVHLQSLRTENQ